MIRRLPRFAIVFPALLAVLWAQIFGLERGFWCECDGASRLTQADHCHGDAADHAHPLSDHAPDDPVHEHDVAVERLHAKPAPHRAPPPPPVSVLAPVMWENAGVISRGAIAAAALMPEPPPESSSPAGGLVRTVAQRI